MRPRVPPARALPRTRTPTPTATNTQGPPSTGQRLVLATFPDPLHPEEQPDILVINLDGSGKRNLTNTPGLADFNPVWSPDGKKIAWAANTIIPDVGQYRHIVIMNADGTGRTDLMPDARGAADEPSWSPDAQKIVFEDLDRIAVIDANGANEHTILTSRNRIGSPDWSPDGTKIVFTGTLHIPESQSDHADDQEIYVMNSNGSNPTRLTTNSYPDEFPAWSPDGKKIAFESSPSLEFPNVSVMNPDGSQPTKLIQGLFGRTAPAWSKDGTQIAYYSGYPPTGIYVANADGSSPVLALGVAAPCFLTGPTCTFFDLR